MERVEIKLPSNKKFGYFFTLIFFIFALFFSYSENYIIVYFLITSAVLFLIITLINPRLLLPLNKIWMNLGFFLGKIISPIVLGIIFFGLFTPIAMLMRTIGRDELRLNLKNKISNWKVRLKNTSQTDFKNQF
jgi:membrane glycosyltransferase